MVETDSLSFILSCCSIPFYIIGLIGNVLVIHFLSGCVGQGDSNINLARKIHLIVFDALFLIQSVVMVFCYGSLIRGLYFTNAECQETETTDGERRSEKKKLVITFPLATVGFLIGYVHSMAFYTVVTFQTNANIDINLYSDLENGFQFLFGYSLCLNPLVYAFRSAHFKEGFRRVLTTCWKPTPQDDNVQCVRYFFLFMSQHEVEEKLRSENFAATQTIGFDNAE